MKVPINALRLSRHCPQGYKAQSSLPLRRMLLEHPVDMEIPVRETEDRAYEILGLPEIWHAARHAGATHVQVRVLSPLTEEEERILVAHSYTVRTSRRNAMQLARDIAADYEELKTHTTRAMALAASLHNLGRSQASHLLRLLNLPDDVQALIEKDRLGERHARELTRLKNARRQRALAQRIVHEGLSTRETKALVDEHLQRHVPQKSRPEDPADAYANDPDVKRLAIEVGELIGCRVSFTPGVMHVEHSTLDDLQLLLQRLRATRRPEPHGPFEESD